MQRGELVGTWRKVAVGPSRLDPDKHFELLTLRDDGTAEVLYRVEGEEHRDRYLWEYVNETRWSLLLPFGTGMANRQGPTVEVRAYEVVRFTGDTLEVKRHIPPGWGPLVQEHVQRLLKQFPVEVEIPVAGPGDESWNPVTRYERVT
jgi:hypothetical protein